MILLETLSTVRIARHIERHRLANVTGIDVDRIRNFETGRKRAEPWLSEAFLIHRALGTQGIMALVDGSERLTAQSSLDLGVSLPTDVAMFRSGVRLPLSLACRVTLKLGLDDPAQLFQPDPLFQQVWEVLENNERGAAIGECPWCRCTESHHESCLPNNLWGARRPTGGTLPGPAPRPATMGNRTGSANAPGLKTMRERKGWTQVRLAGSMGLNSSYLARIERCEAPLTTAKAEIAAHLLGCEIPDFYHTHDRSADNAEA